MSGLFEHIAAFDNDERRGARQAVAVAHKRVNDRVGGFIFNASSIQDFNARLSLVEEDVRRIVSDVVAEYGGDAQKVLDSITAGWEDLERGNDGRWTSPAAQQAEEAESPDLDTELSDAPSAVGEGTHAKVRPFLASGLPCPQCGEVSADPNPGQCEHCGFVDHGPQGNEQLHPDVPEVHSPNYDQWSEGLYSRQAADAPSGVGGEVERVSLPTGDDNALGGPSPKIDKGTAGDEKSNNLSPIKTEGPKSRNPTVQQSTHQTDLDDEEIERGINDLRYEDIGDVSKNTLKTQELPTADEWAGFADGGVAHGDHTKTFPKKNLADPVTSRTAEHFPLQEAFPQGHEGDAQIECPRCHGFDPACPTCGGDRQVTAPVPGGDGTITPDELGPEYMPTADMGSFPKYQGGRSAAGPVPGVEPIESGGGLAAPVTVSNPDFDDKYPTEFPHPGMTLCRNCGEANDTPQFAGQFTCENCGAPTTGLSAQHDMTDEGAPPARWEASVDPDKNPIVENLRAWQDEQGVREAIARYEKTNE